MHKKMLYTCDICGTDYANAENANDCERNHKLLEKAVITGEYRPQKMCPDGLPVKIKVQFPGSDQWVQYKR